MLNCEHPNERKSEFEQNQEQKSVCYRMSSSKKMGKSASSTISFQPQFYYPPPPFPFNKQMLATQPKQLFKYRSNRKPKMKVQNENEFFQRILMEEAAPKTYKQVHKYKQQKAPSSSERQKSAGVIQRSWRKYRRSKLLNRIYKEEAIINQFQQVSAVRRILKVNEGSDENFENLVIERLLLDISIGNKIIIGMQHELKLQKNDRSEQQEQIKQVLEEYVQFIDSLIEQKQQMESQIREQESQIRSLQELSGKQNDPRVIIEQMQKNFVNAYEQQQKNMTNELGFHFERQLEKIGEMRESCQNYIKQIKQLKEELEIVTRNENIAKEKSAHYVEQLRVINLECQLKEESMKQMRLEVTQREESLKQINDQMKLLNDQLRSMKIENEQMKALKLESDSIKILKNENHNILEQIKYLNLQKDESLKQFKIEQQRIINEKNEELQSLTETIKKMKQPDNSKDAMMIVDLKKLIEDLQRSIYQLRQEKDAEANMLRSQIEALQMQHNQNIDHNQTQMTKTPKQKQSQLSRELMDIHQALNKSIQRSLSLIN